MDTTPIYEIMTTEVYEVAPDTSLETAARLLTTRGISGVPVVQKSGDIVGVVSLADLADPDRPQSASPGYPTYYLHSRTQHTECGEHVQVGEGCVADVMRRQVLTIEANATVAEAAARLADDEVHRLLVVHRHKLVGIVTTHDVLRGFLHIPHPKSGD